MSQNPAQSPNPRGQEYWNSPTTRAWADEHVGIDRLMTDVTAIAMSTAAPRPGEQVLDIGCGSGTTVLELARKVGAGGHVLGVDISEYSIERARQRIAEAGLAHAEAAVADVSVYAFEPRRFDLAFSRFGVMFFNDPVATLGNLRKGLKPDGRLALAVFQGRGRNRWATAPLAAVADLVPPPAPPGPEEPGQFSWADQARVRHILESAGFRDVSLSPHDIAVDYAGPGGAKDAAAFSMMVGPIVRPMLDAPPPLRETVRARLEAFFEGEDGPHGIIMPGAIWMVEGRA